MNDNQEFLNLITLLGEHIENNYIISAQLIRTFEDLKTSIIVNKLGVWNTVLQGFDQYE